MINRKEKEKDTLFGQLLGKK